MSLSIVIPARDEAARIGRALAALAAQGAGERAEVIVCDDGSTDGTADVVAQGWPFVRIVQGEGRGPGVARTLALQEAGGERIAFIDADAIPDPGWLDAALRAGSAEPTMGRVRAEPGTLASLVALSCFGPFLDPRPRMLASFAFVNVVLPRALLERFPIPGARVGEDRLLSWALAREGVRSRFDPRMAVVHAPPLGAREVVRRQASYARRFVANRRSDATLPGGALTQLPAPLAGPAVALSRLAIDVGRLDGARRGLGLPAWRLPLIAMGLAALRAVDAAVIARG